MKIINLELTRRNIELRFPEEVSIEEIEKAVKILEKAKNVYKCYSFDPYSSNKKTNDNLKEVL